MSSGLMERIKQYYDQLSPSQRTVAEFLVREPGLLAFGTAAAIGGAAGVSETTVIRLAHTLGYRGFADMQEHTQGLLAPKLMPELISRAATEFPQGAGVMGRVLEHDLHLIRQAIALNQSKVFDSAVEILSAARQILVTGARSSYGVAHLFWYTLRMQIARVTFLEANTPPFLSNLAEMGADSALVVASFPRYSDTTLDIARYAKEKGCPIVAITDDPLSPLGRMAQAALIAPTESVAATMSFAPVVGLMTALITGVALQRRKQVDRRLAHLEQVHTDWKRVSRDR
ncbi:MAG: putative RpiR family transcriptional regulator [Firmicutes bacterium]|nr:putative RpiR family transcriptional regulator [Bacillota bacterium]